MDLWIRSQDKEKLVKINNARYFDMADNYETEQHSIWNENDGILGVYKSKERALEVLDEIQRTLSKVLLSDYKDGYKLQAIDTAIYEMPKE